MSNAIEVAKILVSPINKLIDAVTGAIGKAYEPHHKRKMADATAYEITTVGEAMRNVTDMPVFYNKDGVSINSDDLNRLIQRTATRFVRQEVTKQCNIEQVVDSAYDILEQEESCSEEPVEQTWLNRFFDSVANISDTDMQKLWGKILAGEIKQPKTYSLRTLETLKNLSKYEAELFQKIVPYIVNLNGSLFLSSNSEILQKHGILFGEILRLDECGLINSSGLISLNPEVSSANFVGLYNRSKLVLLHGLKTSNVKVSIGAYGLTKAGKELFNILDGNSNDEYIYNLAKDIAKKNCNKVKVYVHQINYFDVNGSINYEETALCEFPTKNEDVS